MTPYLGNLETLPLSSALLSHSPRHTNTPQSHPGSFVPRDNSHHHSHHHHRDNSILDPGTTWISLFASWVVGCYFLQIDGEHLQWSSRYRANNQCYLRLVKHREARTVNKPDMSHSLLTEISSTDPHCTPDSIPTSTIQ